MLTPDKTETRRCPYLGLEDDLTTVTDFPSLLNYCHRCRPIEVPSALHQRTICLGSDYVRCTIFSSFNQRAMPKAMRWQHEPIFRKKIFLWIVLGIFLITLAGLLFVFWGDLFPAKPVSATEAIVYFTSTSTSTDLPTATQTQTPRPTSTATRIASKPSSTFTLSPTTALTLVSVSRATSCRTGPSVSYPKVGDLNVGVQAVIMGRTADSEYWLIENPTREGTCWIWAQYSTVTGPMEGVPIITPPPKPITTQLPSPIPTTIDPTPIVVIPTTVPSPTLAPTIDIPTEIPTNTPTEIPPTNPPAPTPTPLPTDG